MTTNNPSRSTSSGPSTSGSTPNSKASSKNSSWRPSQRWATSPEAVRKRTMWQSWAALSPTTRLRISLALCGFAVAGMYATDLLEKRMPPPPKSQPGRAAGLGD